MTIRTKPSAENSTTVRLKYCPVGIADWGRRDAGRESARISRDLALPRTGESADDPQRVETGPDRPTRLERLLVPALSIVAAGYGIAVLIRVVSAYDF